jgi:hypothetical protein
MLLLGMMLLLPFKKIAGLCLREFEPFSAPAVLKDGGRSSPSKEETVIASAHEIEASDVQANIGNMQEKPVDIVPGFSISSTEDNNCVTRLKEFVPKHVS